VDTGKLVGLEQQGPVAVLKSIERISRARPHRYRLGVTRTRSSDLGECGYVNRHTLPTASRQRLNPDLDTSSTPAPASYHAGTT
jgi:hypothetical protein